MRGHEPAGLESKAGRTEEKMLQNEEVVQKTQSDLGPEAGFVQSLLRKAFSEKPSPKSFFRFQARCSASYGPKVEQPSTLNALAHVCTCTNVQSK